MKRERHVWIFCDRIPSLSILLYDVEKEEETKKLAGKEEIKS